MKNQTTLLILVFLSINLHATRANSFVTTMGVTTIIDQLLTGINETIQQMEQSSSILMFQARQDLIFTAQNLKDMAVKFEDKLFKDLTSLQQQTFNNAQMLLDGINEDIENSLEKVDSLVRLTGTEISRTPTFDKRPMVSSMEPGYIVYFEDNSTIFNFKGSRLGSGEATLSFNNSTCEKLSNTELDISFKCSNSIFKTDDNWVSGNIDILVDEPWYNIFSNDKNYSYDVSLKKIQPLIGSIKLSSKVEKIETKRVARSKSDDSHVAPCRSNNPVWSYTPGKSCYVDVATINVKNTVLSSQSSYYGVRSQTSTGFQVAAKAKGSGDRVFGKCVGGGRGAVVVVATWTDICEVKTNESIQVNKLENGDMFYWGQDIIYQLPENTIGFSFTLEQKDGRTITMSKSDQSDWFNLEYNEITQTILIKPKLIEQVAFSASSF